MTTTKKNHGPFEITKRSHRTHNPTQMASVSRPRKKRKRRKKNSNKTPPVKLTNYHWQLGNERNMCMERVPSLRTAPTTNFDGVMLVLIRYLMQPVRRGNATHQVHRRRHVNGQNPVRGPGASWDHTTATDCDTSRGKTTPRGRPHMHRCTTTISGQRTHHQNGIPLNLSPTTRRDAVWRGDTAWFGMIRLGVECHGMARHGVASRVSAWRAVPWRGDWSHVCVHVCVGVQVGVSHRVLVCPSQHTKIYKTRRVHPRGTRDM